MVPVPDTVEYCRTKPDVYCIPLHLLQRLQARYLYAEIQKCSIYCTTKYSLTVKARPLKPF